jgi:hypothetical protein
MFMLILEGTVERKAANLKAADLVRQEEAAAGSTNSAAGELRPTPSGNVDVVRQSIRALGCKGENIEKKGRGRVTLNRHGIINCGETY